jgi:hypothetical protein
MVHDDRKLQSPWGRSPEQCVQGRWRAVATAFSGQPHEFLRSTVLAWNAVGITGQSPLPNTALSAFPALSDFAPSSETPGSFVGHAGATGALLWLLAIGYFTV